MILDDMASGFFRLRKASGRLELALRIDEEESRDLVSILEVYDRTCGCGFDWRGVKHIATWMGRTWREAPVHTYRAELERAVAGGIYIWRWTRRIIGSHSPREFVKSEIFLLKEEAIDAARRYIHATVEHQTQINKEPVE